MNWTFEEYMKNYLGDSNVSFDLSDLYENMDGNEIESFTIWEERLETLKIVNKLFTIVASILCVVDLFLLVPALLPSAREKSASWYLYHLNFVTVLHMSFSLPRLEDDLHKAFGTCMFFSFTHWTLTFVYYVNLALMNIEILAGIFASNPRWKPNPRKRFVISMTAMWITCILFSTCIMFFGHEEHELYPICFHQNDIVRYIGLIAKDWFPALFIFAETIAGIVLFIRAKRSPDNYSHMMTNGKSLQEFNEWFACFMAWNMTLLVTDGLLFEVFMTFFGLGFFNDIILQIIVFLLRGGLPLSCLMLGPVRGAYVEGAKKVVQFVTGEKHTRHPGDTDTHELRMEVQG